jgi:hypothetical protein
MSDIGDRDLFGLGGRAAKADRDGKRRPARHREAFAAQRLLLGGRRDDHRTEEGKGKGYVKRSQHGMTRPRQRPEGYCIAEYRRHDDIRAGSVADLLHRWAAVP